MIENNDEFKVPWKIISQQFQKPREHLSINYSLIIQLFFGSRISGLFCTTFSKTLIITFLACFFLDEAFENVSEFFSHKNFMSVSTKLGIKEIFVIILTTFKAYIVWSRIVDLRSGLPKSFTWKVLGELAPISKSVKSARTFIWKSAINQESYGKWVGSMDFCTSSWECFFLKLFELLLISES